VGVKHGFGLAGSQSVVDAHNFVRPEPFKYIRFPNVKNLGLKITPNEQGEAIVLSAQRPIKGIVLEVDGEDVKWGDQALDLVPGDPQTVKVIGLKGRPVKARFLGDNTA
jgi:beta-mannosidase